jgi:hypothetical protein
MIKFRKRRYRKRPVIKVNGDMLDVWQLFADVGILVFVILSVGLQIADMMRH